MIPASHFFSSLYDFPWGCFAVTNLFVISLCPAVSSAALGSFKRVRYKINNNNVDVYGTYPQQFQGHPESRHREASNKGVTLHLGVLSINKHRPALICGEVFVDYFFAPA